MIGNNTNTVESNMRLKSLKNKPRAYRIKQKDLFNNKFFVEDFLEDINKNSLLD